MGWFSADERERRGWNRQIAMDNGGRGSRDTSPRTFPWDVTQTEGAQKAKAKGWWT